MDKEHWKDIPDFDKYEISDHGNVRNKRTKHILKTQIGNSGYTNVALFAKDKTIRKNIHRLVAENFISNPNELPAVNHMDGNKRNNASTNLEWCTRSQNMRHAYNNGLWEPPNSIPVRIVETGETFSTISECAHHINGNISHIYQCIIGNRTTHKGLHFERI